MGEKAAVRDAGATQVVDLGCGVVAAYTPACDACGGRMFYADVDQCVCARCRDRRRVRAESSAVPAPPASEERRR